MCLVAFLLPGLVWNRPATAQTQPASPPSELHEALVGQLNKLNPLFAQANPVDATITSLIFEGLTTVNQYGEVVPDLAERWSISQDGLEYVFFLRRDVLWQDGLPFTSADVAYTFRTLRDRDFPGDPALRDFWRSVEITVIDEHTLRFRLVQPLAAFPYKLQQGIVPVHALEGAPIATLDQHPFNLSPIGTGPYQLESLFSDAGNVIGASLRVAPNFLPRPDGAPGYTLDRLVFWTYPTLDAAIEALLGGEVNALGGFPGDRLAELAPLQTLTVQATLAPEVGMLLFNWQRDELAYFRQRDFRRALALGTNRQTVVNNALPSQAVVTDSPFLPGSWAHNPLARLPDHNLEEARRLLEGVSFEPPAPEEGEEAVEIRRDFRIMVLDDPRIAGVAFEVAAQWSGLGFGVELDIVDAETLAARLESHDFDVALIEIALSADPDQYPLWHQDQIENGQNFAGVVDTQLSGTLVAARRDSNGANRKRLYDLFQETFVNRVPALPLYNPLYYYVVDARLQGVQLEVLSNPMGRFNTVSALVLPCGIASRRASPLRRLPGHPGAGGGS
ncbi:MAG: peptide ABC transporter substrate-binding protein [Anaerolineae bacterium]|nr:peptide ABC transporter substrate-binding protein [Anaerolineae bacterium]